MYRELTQVEVAKLMKNPAAKLNERRPPPPGAHWSGECARPGKPPDSWSRREIARLAAAILRHLEYGDYSVWLAATPFTMARVNTALHYLARNNKIHFVGDEPTLGGFRV